MKNIFKRQFTEEEKIYLRKNRKLLLLRSFLLLGFLLVFNAFAWFIYISQVDTEMDVHVLGWDVVFSEGSNNIKKLDIVVDIYPGMQNYTKTVQISNSSETNAKISFDIQNATLFGKNLLQDGMTEEQKEAFLRETLPFVIDLEATTEVMTQSSVAQFMIDVGWEYEADKFFKVPSIFDYSSEVSYYTQSGGVFVKDTSVTSTNFASKIGSIYMEKDEMDSYIGEKCSAYVKENQTYCLKIEGQLIAEQQNS